MKYTFFRKKQQYLNIKTKIMCLQDKLILLDMEGKRLNRIETSEIQNSIENNS